MEIGVKLLSQERKITGTGPKTEPGKFPSDLVKKDHRLWYFPTVTLSSFTLTLNVLFPHSLEISLDPKCEPWNTDFPPHLAHGRVLYASHMEYVEKERERERRESVSNKHYFSSNICTRVATVQSSPPSPQALNWDWTSVPAILQDLSPQSL